MTPAPPSGTPGAWIDRDIVRVGHAVIRSGNWRLASVQLTRWGLLVPSAKLPMFPGFGYSLHGMSGDEVVHMRN